MALIYRHLKPCGEVFYIGIGNDISRAYSITNRNIFWERIVDKHPYEVQILKSDLTWEEAKELEVILISYYGRRDLGKGTLVNLTDGGEGQLNPSKETRQKMTGNKKNIKGEQHHFFGVPKTDEHKQKLREAKLGKKLSEEHKKKISENSRSKEVVGKKVICIITKQIWDCILDCEKDTGIKNLRDYLNPNRTNLKNKTPIQYLEDYDKGFLTALQKVRHHDRKVINETTGKEYNTIKEAALVEKIGESTLYRAFKKGNIYTRENITLRVIN